MKKLYVIHDVMARAIHLVFEQPNDSCAIRAMQRLIDSTPDSDGMSLWCLGDLIADQEEPTSTQDARLIGTFDDLRSKDEQTS